MAHLSNVAQLIPGLASPVLASRVDPVLNLSQTGLDILPIAEAAALPPQQQLVEQLHVHKAEQLLEQLAHLQTGTSTDEGGCVESPWPIDMLGA